MNNKLDGWTIKKCSVTNGYYALKKGNPFQLIVDYRDGKYECDMLHRGKRYFYFPANNKPKRAHLESAFEFLAEVADHEQRVDR
jgi:hypothetical protein